MEMITATEQGWIHICPNMMCSCSNLLCIAFLKPNFFPPFFLTFSNFFKIQVYFMALLSKSFLQNAK